MITKDDLIKTHGESERSVKLEAAFSLMLQRYLPNKRVISLRCGLGSKEICEDGELLYKSEKEGSMQFQRHELASLVKKARENGFQAEYIVNSHNVGFYHISL